MIVTTIGGKVSTSQTNAVGVGGRHETDPTGAVKPSRSLIFYYLERRRISNVDETRRVRVYSEWSDVINTSQIMTLTTMSSSSSVHGQHSLSQQ
jgi:hypothetical protein